MILNWILLIIAVLALVYFIPKKNKDKIAKLAIFFWVVMLAQDILRLCSYGVFATVVQFILLAIALVTLAIELVHIFKRK